MIACWIRFARGGSRRPRVVHATGACALRSDVVQVQFVHAAWEKERAGAGLARRSPYHWLLSRFDLATERLAFRPGKTYIAISESVARELAEHHGIRERVHVIRHGVDPEAFRPASAGPLRERREAMRRELGFGPDEAIILLVGTYERKGLSAALEALGRMSPGALARARLLAVGAGDRERFRAEARRLGVDARVTLLGPSADIAPCFRLADVFLLPTLYEPFGMVILEAMACGLPVVVSARAGASELVTAESGTKLADPRDPAEVARALEPLVLDAGLRSRAAAAARRIAEARTWDIVADEYARVLEPLLRARAEGGQGAPHLSKAEP